MFLGVYSLIEQSGVLFLNKFIRFGIFNLVERCVVLLVYSSIVFFCFMLLFKISLKKRMLFFAKIVLFAATLFDFLVIFSLIAYMLISDVYQNFPPINKVTSLVLKPVNLLSQEKLSPWFHNMYFQFSFDTVSSLFVLVSFTLITVVAVRLLNGANRCTNLAALAFLKISSVLAFSSENVFSFVFGVELSI